MMQNSENQIETLSGLNWGCPPSGKDSFHDELDFFPASAAKIALSSKISSQDTMTDSKVRSDGRIVFYALEIV